MSHFGHQFLSEILSPRVSPQTEADTHMENGIRGECPIPKRRPNPEMETQSRNGHEPATPLIQPQPNNSSGYHYTMLQQLLNLFARRFQMALQALPRDWTQLDQRKQSRWLQNFGFCYEPYQRSLVRE